MKDHVHRVAFAALLAAPILAVPVWTASTASAASAASAPSCPAPAEPVSFDKVEGLIGNLSPAAGATVAPGATISFLIADELPFPQPLAHDVYVTVDGVWITPTAGAEESGVPITYTNPQDQGSQSTACEVPYSFVLPSTISGSVRIRLVARDGDGDVEAITWTLAVQTTALPDGAVGGIGLAAVGGLVLTVVQLRRRVRRPHS